MQSDEGLERFMKAIKIDVPISEAVIGRDVRQLPDKVVEREAAVRGLEYALIKYLKGN
jgi:hypothetical protein